VADQGPGEAAPGVRLGLSLAMSKPNRLNPLADPGIMGVEAGASLAVALADRLRRVRLRRMS
jgi:ABC-type Fe3+-siderophore transport system permease subunit